VLHRRASLSALSQAPMPSNPAALRLRPSTLRPGSGQAQDRRGSRLCWGMKPPLFCRPGPHARQPLCIVTAGSGGSPKGQDSCYCATPGPSPGKPLVGHAGDAIGSEPHAPSTSTWPPASIQPLLRTSPRCLRSSPGAASATRSVNTWPKDISASAGKGCAWCVRR